MRNGDRRGGKFVIEKLHPMGFPPSDEGRTKAGGSLYLKWSLESIEWVGSDEFGSFQTRYWFSSVMTR
jgi:hypothetical protein